MGYAILNCGAIEQLTYAYAAQLQGEHVFGTGLGRKSFSKRRNHVVDLLREANVDDDLRKRAIELWSDAEEVMQKRNVVAHNPITRVRIDRATGGEETMLAVVDMAESIPTNIRSLDASNLSNLVNRANEVASGLSECLESFNESAID